MNLLTLWVVGHPFGKEYTSLTNYRPLTGQLGHSHLGPASMSSSSAGGQVISMGDMPPYLQAVDQEADYSNLGSRNSPFLHLVFFFSLSLIELYFK